MMNNRMTATSNPSSKTSSGVATIGAALLALCTTLSGQAAHAQDAGTSCAQHYLGGQVPVFANRAMLARTQELCYRTFADLHSAVIREPLYAAEHLTADSVAAAKGSDRREMQFHPDPHIAEGDRGELSDYARSGFDRGHMANWADTADPDSFSLGNMVPQNPDNNRRLWEGIETATRNMASEDGEVYVMSGPIFAGQQIQYLRGHVAIPTMLFKAVYDPKRGAGVYLTENAPGSVWQEISVAQLTQMTGIDPFPALPADVKAQMASFDVPDVHGHSIPANGTVQPLGIPGMGNGSSEVASEGGVDVGTASRQTSSAGGENYGADARHELAHELMYQALHAAAHHFLHSGY